MAGSTVDAWLQAIYGIGVAAGTTAGGRSRRLTATADMRTAPSRIR
jgi:hypothetical protein